LKHIEPPPEIDTSTKTVTASANGDTATNSGDTAYRTYTKRSLNQAPFDKISKSGDGGGSGGLSGY